MCQNDLYTASLVPNKYAAGPENSQIGFSWKWMMMTQETRPITPKKSQQNPDANWFSLISLLIH